ncbi:efflux RND transporter periplasmic adaptor subunit [Marinobacteraceae bacterium S3BR75-40.1]
MYRHSDPMETQGGEVRQKAPGKGRHALFGVLVLCAGVALTAYLFMSSGQVGTREPPQRSARLVDVVPVSVAPHRVSVTAWGTVTPSRSLALKPRVSGRVETLGAHFEPGSLLEQGELLARLDDTGYRLALQRARADLTRARSDLALEQGQQAVAKREYELLAESASDAERALMLRQPQLQTAQANVAAAQADLEDAQLALDYTRIDSPFDALVLSREVAEGAEVTTGTTLAELVGIHTWWVELSVPASALQWIQFPGPERAGSAVTLYHDGVWGPGQTRSGHVVRLLGDLQESSKMARVLVAVQDPLGRTADTTGPQLLLGSFLRAEIQGRSLPDSVALEPAWVRGDDSVWLMDAKDRLRIQPVTIAYRDKQRVLVRTGLSEGDRIVTSKLSVPSEGMPLRVEEPSDG